MKSNILEELPHLSPKQIDRCIDEMNRAFLEAAITGYEQLIEAMINQPNDRHVLAAAVRGNVGVIVTNNIRDFPKESYEQFELDIQTPDIFLEHALFQDPIAVYLAINQQASSKKNPPMKMSDVLDHLNRHVPRFVQQATSTWNGDGYPPSSL